MLVFVAQHGAGQRLLHHRLLRRAPERLDVVDRRRHQPRAAPAQAHEALLLGREQVACRGLALRSEEHTSELQSLMRISYAVFCLKKKNTHTTIRNKPIDTYMFKHYTNYTSMLLH